MASVYGACKSFQESMGNHYFNHFGVDNIGLRFTVVYGYGRDRGTVAFATELAEHAALNKPYNLPYPLDTALSWEYVDDAVRAILTASNAGKTKTRVFTTGGDNRSIKEAVNYIQKILPEAKFTFNPDPNSPYQLLSAGKLRKYDVRRIREEIGYERQFPMEAGLHRTINEFRKKAGLPSVGGSISYDRFLTLLGSGHGNLCVVFGGRLPCA